ncbi:MAG: PKD domain-containing protein [Stagnimonas sp.]|nr:PKD domain-containing protein [Stagnimonas sp.]
MIHRRHPALAWLLFLALAPSMAARAATPASGSLAAAGDRLSYSAGPFAGSNASATTTPAAPSCLNPVQPCDDFALTVTAPAASRNLLRVSALYPINQDVYYVYLIDSTGSTLAYSLSANDPNVLAYPSAPGEYTVRIVPQQAAGDTLSVTVELLGDQTAPASGIAPRFLQVASPATLGNNTAGEMNIGYNPHSGRVLSLGYTQTLRTTFPEQLEPPLPEVCDAQWEDVSDPRTQLNTNDPILYTDQHTGRTFISQLQAGGPGESIFVYSDDDGDSWALTPLTLNGGIDHQTVGGGPYREGSGVGPSGDYPHAVYYCSQSIAAAFCARSDDGGASFGPPAISKTAADCDGFLGGIHGHVRVAPDGTVYVPDRGCGGQQALLVSEDSGQSFSARRVPGSSTGASDPSLGIGADGTGYFCYLNGDGHVRVAVTSDRGQTYGEDHDISYTLGVEHAVFPTAIAGDGDRAACAFLGTTTRGNFESVDFPGLWHAYVAMTYDGGKTWHTVMPNPEDPVQGRGGICLAGTTCLSNRNLLDFNDITLDHRGRPLFGFDDGCTGACVETGMPNQVVIPGLAINSDAKTTLLRQIGGRSLYAAYDPVEPAPPRAACLAGSRDKYVAHLGWRVPDHGGAAIAGYRIYRGDSAEQQDFLTRIEARAYYNDTQNDPARKYWYRISAENDRGEGLDSNLIALEPSEVVPENTEPTPILVATPAAGTAPLEVRFDVSGSDPDAGDALASYSLDFGDGEGLSDQPFDGAAMKSLSHRYAGAGGYDARLTVKDSHGLVSSNAALQRVQADAGGTAPPATPGAGTSSGGRYGGALGGPLLLGLWLLARTRRRRRA